MGTPTYLDIETPEYWEKMEKTIKRPAGLTVLSRPMLEELPLHHQPEWNSLEQQ